MRRAVNRCTTRVTEWQLRRSQGRQRTRWRDEIRAFAGQDETHWDRAGRGGECWERPLCCRGLVMADDNDAGSGFQNTYTDLINTQRIDN